MHILPMFGEYAMNYLNSNTEIISDELTKKSKEYANIKLSKAMFALCLILPKYYVISNSTELPKLFNVLPRLRKWL